MPNATAKSRQGIQSIEVGARLLQALAESGGAMMLRDLASAAGMPAAKAHRYLVSFVRIGLVSQDAASGRYDLGAFALTLGLAALARLDAVRLATPHLERLNQRTGETVALAVWGNLGPTMVRWLEARRPVTVNLRTGSVMSLIGSATGLAFAAFGDSPLVQQRIDEELAVAARAADDPRPKSRAELEPILAAARRHGLARVEGVVLPGINAFGAPVFDHQGKLVLVITALGPAGLFPADWDSEAARLMKQTAADLSRELGWVAAATRSAGARRAGGGAPRAM